MTEEVFCRYYEKYRNTVYSVVFNYVQNVEDTADLMQEVFLKFLYTDTEFLSEEHMKAWLIRVSINHCKNHFRSIKNRKNTTLDEDIPYYDETSDNELLQFVMKLPEKYRIPVHLFYYEEYSVKEIANVLDMPEATVKVRLKRGREKLGKKLVKEDWV